MIMTQDLITIKIKRVHAQGLDFKAIDSAVLLIVSNLIINTYWEGASVEDFRLGRPEDYLEFENSESFDLTFDSNYTGDQYWDADKFIVNKKKIIGATDHQEGIEVCLAYIEIDETENNIYGFRFTWERV